MWSFMWFCGCSDCRLGSAENDAQLRRRIIWRHVRVAQYGVVEGSLPSCRKVFFFDHEGRRNLRQMVYAAHIVNKEGVECGVAERIIWHVEMEQQTTSNSERGPGTIGSRRSRK